MAGLIRLSLFRRRCGEMYQGAKTCPSSPTFPPHTSLVNYLSCVLASPLLWPSPPLFSSPLFSLKGDAGMCCGSDQVVEEGAVGQYLWTGVA